MTLLQDTPPRSRPYRILLAEDDLEMRRLLAWSLERSGYEVVECADGITLLRKLGRHGWTQVADPFDLVISDICMPGYTGLDVLSSVNEFEECPPIVLISAFVNAEASDQAVELGAAALLPKPFDVAELIEKVEQILPDVAAPVSAPDPEPAERPPTFPLDIEFRHGDVAAPVEEFIHELAGKLDRQANGIRRCRVVIDALAPPGSRHHWYSVKVILATRTGGTVVAERQSSPGHGDESLYLNLHMAFAAAHRQLGKKQARRNALKSRRFQDAPEEE